MCVLDAAAHTWLQGLRKFVTVTAQNSLETQSSHWEKGR